MKRFFKIIVVVLITLIVLWLMAFCIDYYRCSHLKEPVFALSKLNYSIAFSNGRKDYSYRCLGYRVELSTIPTLENGELVTWIEMHAFNKRILNKKIEITESLNNIASTKSAVVVKVNDKCLDVMGFEHNNDLYCVSFASEGNIGFKQGQEILIYYDGIIAQSFPAQINHVKKIEIVQQNSNIEIPDDVIRWCYNSRNNVSVSINNFTNSGISLTITDTNKLPYDYSNSYTIYKKNKKSEKVTIDTNRIIPGTENSTSAYIPDNIQPLWEEVPKISNILSEDTGIFSSSNNILKKTYDWTNLYGNLGDRRV